jgi:hypothetical protein
MEGVGVNMSEVGVGYKRWEWDKVQGEEEDEMTR